VEALHTHLARRVDFNGFDDPKTTLQAALQSLAKQYFDRDDVFDVNERAFEFEQVKDVLKTEVASPNPIPPMKNARLDAVLRKVLSRVHAVSGATWVLRPERIEITTETFQAPEIWGKYDGPHFPVVHVILDKVPLEQALKDLAEQAEFNILLDSRAAEKAKTLLTARLRNTPLDTALCLLTDMTDLRWIHLDNVLYVTTLENAAALEARLETERKAIEKEKAASNPLDDNSLPPGRYRKGTGRPPTVHAAPMGALR
jgi:hypothetical protein